MVLAFTVRVPDPGTTVARPTYTLLKSLVQAFEAREQVQQGLEVRMTDELAKLVDKRISSSLQMTVPGYWRGWPPIESAERAFMIMESLVREGIAEEKVAMHMYTEDGQFLQRISYQRFLDECAGKVECSWNKDNHNSHWD